MTTLLAVASLTLNTAAGHGELPQARPSERFSKVLALDYDDLVEAWVAASVYLHGTGAPGLDDIDVPQRTDAVAAREGGEEVATVAQPSLRA